MRRAGRSPGCTSGAFLLLMSLAAAGPRSPDAVVHEMAVAQHDLKVAIGDPRDMADPVKRAVIAPRAVPPLRLLIADDRELAVGAGRAVPDFFEVQLRAIGSALGDAESTAALSRLAADPPRSLRGEGGQLLARWLQAPGDAAAQGKVVDDLAMLDGAHPDSDDLARFTAMMIGSAATPAMRSRLYDLLGPMTSPAANGVRQRLPTTRP